MKKTIYTVEIILTIIVTLLVTIIVTNFLVRPAQVKGNSMYPTLQNEDRLFTSVVSRIIGKPNRYDIVVIRRENKEEWVKRIIGLPNETVEIKNNEVYINDKKIDEPYLPKGVRTSNFNKIKLKAGEYFVLGDNREHSTDSRVLNKQITMEEIVSLHAFVYYPFNKVRFIK